MLIRVFLISDYLVATWGLERLLESEPQRFALAGKAFDFSTPALDAARTAAPDIVLLDMDGDPAGAPEFVDHLHAALPRTKILLLTRMENAALQDRAVLAGARGIIKKSIPPDLLLNAIAKVQEGHIWLDREATTRIFVEFSRSGAGRGGTGAGRLTERERQIVAFIARNSGYPGKTLAGKLNISESTLRNHLTAIYEKLGVANRHGLLAYAFRNGLDKQPQ